MDGPDPDGRSVRFKRQFSNGPPNATKAQVPSTISIGHLFGALHRCNSDAAYDADDDI